MHVVCEKLAIVDEYMIHHCCREVNHLPSTHRRYASDCVDRRPSYTNVALPRIGAGGDVVYHTCCCKHRPTQKMQHIFAYNGLPRPLGLSSRDPWLTFLDSSRRAMLTLWLRPPTVFMIFAFKWLFRSPKSTPSPFLVSHLVTLMISPVATRRGDCVRDRYVSLPSCKISRRSSSSSSPSPRYLLPDR